MNNRCFLMIRTCIVFFVAFSFTACNKTIDTGSDAVRTGASIIPNPMQIGQTIMITGPNFKNATAIIFPDNISVSTFEKSGDYQLNVVVPEGINNGGNITVKLSDSDYIIPVAIKIVSPQITEVSSTMKMNNADGIPLAESGETLFVYGEALGYVKEVVFPNDISVNALYFKKSNNSIQLTIPDGIPEKVGELKLLTSIGQTLTANVDFSGKWKPDVSLRPLVGKFGDGREWSWDDKVTVNNNGVFATSNNAYANYKTLSYWWGADQATNNIPAQYKSPAKMKFSSAESGDNIFTVTQVDGVSVSGGFELDMTPVNNPNDGNPWALGKLNIIPREQNENESDEDYNTYYDRLSVLWGSSGYKNGPEMTKMFYILRLDEGSIVVATDFLAKPDDAYMRYFFYKPL